MLFNTENSKYEINTKKRQIRRIGGIKNPTPNQGEDGVWQQYDECSPVEVGATPLIWWSKDQNKATVLSVVKEVF